MTIRRHVAVALGALAVAAPAATAAFVPGGPGADTLTGTPAHDRILARGGDDVVQALAGNDLVHVGPGDDRAEGQDGRDRLFGGTGGDTLIGGEGNDRLWAGAGANSLDGGAGDDRLWAGPGDDVLEGGDGNDRLRAGAGADVLRGGEGDDVQWSLRRDGTVDSHDCGPGNDRAYVRPGDTTVGCEVVIVVPRGARAAGRDPRPRPAASTAPRVPAARGAPSSRPLPWEPTDPEGEERRRR